MALFNIKKNLAKWLFNDKQLAEVLLKSLDLNYGTLELNRAFYEFFGPGNRFLTDNTSYFAIKQGYEKNADVFSIADKVSTYFASVDLIPYNIQTEEKSEFDPLKELFSQNNIDKTFREHRKEWELFGMITGNSIVHTPKYSFGNNAGEIMKFVNLPTQNIEIESGGIKRIISMYRFTMGDTSIGIPPEEIWHSRGFLNLNYDDGKNFMGISPVKVAAEVIRAQNNGYEMTATTYQNPLPPTIISQKNATQALTPEQRAAMDKLWAQKTGLKKAGKPFWSTGDLQAIRMGYENMKDLDIIGNSQNGRRILCNVWGVPSTLFNDMAAATESNAKQNMKSMYEGRIIPDMNMYLEGVNRIMIPYNIEYRADWSKVPALQQDSLEKAKIYDMGIKNRSVLPDEFRTDVLGKEELTDEQHAELQMNAEFNQPNLQDILPNNQL